MVVQTERTGKGNDILVVTICRSARRNAVDIPTSRDLYQTFIKFDSDSSLKVAVLCGEGSTFCSGADLSSLDERIGGDINATSHIGPMGPSRLILTKPVIAAISGYAVAGGLELALWCDLRVAEENAIFGVFCRRFGVPLIDGGTVRLPQVVGLGRAMDLILTGRAVTAKEALDIGLVTRVVPVGEARSEAVRLADEIAVFPQMCLRADRLSALTNSFSICPESSLRNEFSAAQHVLTSESVAGASAFVRGEGRHGSFSSGEQGNRVPSKNICAVVFDVGGVISDSPFPEIAKYERETGVEEGSLNAILATSDAFKKLECGEIDVDIFSSMFEKECKARGISAAVSGRELMLRITGIKVRDHYLSAIKRLRESGFKVGIITNDVRDSSRKGSVSSLGALVDVIVQSSVVGIRKPSPLIFKLACERLGIQSGQCIFVDDIGRNLKGAAETGMQTLHVQLSDPDGRNALAILGNLVGVSLGDTSKL